MQDADGRWLLFNGKNLDGWAPILGSEGTWAVVEGVLVCKGAGKGWLSTVDEFGDFELSLEFRVPASGNSGVFIRAPRVKDASKQGMEIQLLDDEGPAYKKLQPAQYTGSIYSVVAPSKRAVKPVGEWNALRITCRGPKVAVEVNGERVVDGDMDREEKLRPRPRRGYIGLQNHGSRMEFRRILLRELEGSGL